MFYTNYKLLFYLTVNYTVTSSDKLFLLSFLVRLIRFISLKLKTKKQNINVMFHNLDF